MGRLSPKLRSTSNGVAHWCPACKEPHVYDVPRWSFDGNIERPSFTPSMKIMRGHGFKEICHYFLTAGALQFCGDSTHALAGQTVDLPDWPSDGDWARFEDHNP